jgi:hypothetical protein
MTTTNIIKGLQIIENARPANSTPHHLRAEHDEIFVGSLVYPISDEDKKTLEDLGWIEREDVDGWRAGV